MIVEKSFGGNLCFEQTTIVLNICIILVGGGSRAESWSLLRCLCMSETLSNGW